jgi:hypothetical protein
MTHTGEKPHACDFEGCDYRCALKCNLKIHKMTHTGEKPLACDFEGCEFRSTTQSALKNHKTTHTGEKPYACDFEGCEHRCATCGQLKTHKMTHTGEKPHACDFEGCDYRCALSGALKIHKFYYHTEEGNATRHRDEEIVKKVLVENGFDFKREHQVDLRCALPGATHARGDFVLVFGDTVVFLEVDEDQHKSYGVSCDVRRMADIAASLRIEGNTMRIVFLRYNPHGFEVAGRTKHTKRVTRHARLVSVLSDLQKESPGAGAESDVRVFYLFYDTDSKGNPAIFADDEYDAQAKLWLAKVYID